MFYYIMTAKRCQYPNSGFEIILLNSTNRKSALRPLARFTKREK